MSEYFKTGKLVASYGLKGELVFKHHLGQRTALKGLEAIFIATENDNFIPYFVTAARIKSDTEIYLTLDQVETKEAAHRLCPKEVWFEAADFKKFAARTAPISLLGYTMIQGSTVLGEVLEVIEQPHQVLCTILLNGKEALIPIHEAFLEKVDNKQRQVFVNLPEGLLDIYA
jgi:16S rRNA processing protein RimM